VCAHIQSTSGFGGAVTHVLHINIPFELTLRVGGWRTPAHIHFWACAVRLRPHPSDLSFIVRVAGATPGRRDRARSWGQRAGRGAVWHVVVVVPSRLARVGHVAITIVDCVARAGTHVGWRGATALDDVTPFALPFPLPLAWSMSSLSLPFLVPLSVAELAVVLTFRRPIVADARSQPLVVMNLVRSPGTGGRT